ncbi:type VI secretion system membrane subunit TssM [Paraburkholderia sp.]|uniref:type VI secretion system membrane subunit TssM n=1 Tax=Paraburkholderia sp. TaxID=1926495 RepID=UPI002D22CA92|nr:type VI secretion system membrane subunit TssM [Paraburkholderia sp.]HZZ06508.1 type VI secretion system membrane subunit TssM [Paraburkholderia sp.]
MNILKRIFGWLAQVLRQFGWTGWVWAALLVALIWVVGPLLAIGDTRPLETEKSRYALIALVLLNCAWRLIRRMRRARGPEPLRRATSVPRTDPADDAQRQRLDDLRARFNHARYVLRHAAAPGGRFVAWFDGLTGRHVYRLPWYLVVGSGGAGKTAALLNGGLDLSIAEQAARAAGRRAEPTRACDWWFSNDAVLVDTPGAYLDAADATEPRDAEWRELLTLLRRYRPRQPLNGVVLALGVDTLLALDEAGRAAYAARLRKPLQLMQDTLGMRVPVYLCLTRMDRLDGFCAYFSSLNRDGRAQVWGAAFESGDASSAETCRPAFQALLKRLTDGVGDVLVVEPDLDSRARAFLFPQQFANIEEPLADFCAALFRPSPLETNLLARGFYFTSALQGGLCLDRVLPATMLQMGMAESPPAPAAPLVQHGYFLKQWLREAVFADAGFADPSHGSRRRRLIVHTVIAAVAGVVLFGLLAAWASSYAHNRVYLDEVAAHVQAFNRQAAQPIALTAADVQPLLPMLDALRALPRSEQVDPDAPLGWRYGMGLYQGTRISEASNALYRRALDEKLLPQAAARIERMLADAPPDDPDYSYEALKAYLMLYDASHYDAGFLTAWLTLDTNGALPPALTQDERGRLEAHLANLFASRVVASPFALNAQLVDAVRARLARESPAQRAYHALRRELLRTLPDEPVSVARAGGPQAALVLTRRSGKPLTDGIASLYTYHGYWDGFEPRVVAATARLQNEDPWVLGTRASPATDNARVALEVRRAYLNDYIQEWDAFLNDVSIVDSQSLAQSTQIARILSAPDSPLKQFLQTAADETTLLRARGGGGERPAPGVLQKRIGEARESLNAMFGHAAASSPPPADDKPEAIVDSHFEPLRRLTAAGGTNGAGATSLDGNLRVLDELYSYLTAADAALASGSPPPQTDVFNKLQADAGRLPMPLRKIFGDLSQASAAQVSGGARRNVAQDAQDSLGPLCRQTIAGRYPFARGSNRDVALDDFARLFASGGLMDSFFQKNLVSQIDVRDGRWTFRRDASGKTMADSHLIGAFQNAETIRNVFFAAGAATPSLQIELTPLELDPDIMQYTLDIDGQAMRYAHGPPLPMVVKWPGTRQGAGLVSLRISTQSGSDGVQTQGPWALYRLFDKAHITPDAAPESFIATFDFSGKKLALRVSASSSYNPFQLPQMKAFSCP